MRKIKDNRYYFYYDWLNKDFEEELKSLEEIKEILNEYKIKPGISDGHYIRRDIKDGYVSKYNEEVDKFRKINKCLLFNKTNINNYNG
jgi:hypothetical protein